MRTLKVLVIFMGLAIVIGASVLATLIITRGNRPDAGGGRVQSTVRGNADMASATHDLILPAGARVLDSRIGAGRVTLRAALAGGGEAIFVFDAANGHLIARYNIVSAITGAGAR